MVKISQLFQGTAPALSDPVPGNEAGTTKRWLWSTIRDLFFNNIKTDAPGGDVDYVISGGVWSGTSYGSTRGAAMTALTCRIGGVYIPISAVVSRTFTASKDTYVDVLSNGDGTGALVYTEVANNAASPALAANSLRLAIIVTGAGSIASAASVNQGQDDRLLPISSSVPYAVTDSLGNLIYSRSASPRVIGLRKITADFSTAGTNQLATGLTVTVKVPAGKRVEIRAFSGAVYNSTSPNSATMAIWDGTVGSGTQIGSGGHTSSGNNAVGTVNAVAFQTPSLTTDSTKTYNVGLSAGGGGTATLGASSVTPAFIVISIV